MACVVAWFCECGSIVRMSFCAAQRSVTAACAGPSASARMKSSVRIIPPPGLLERQAFLHQRGEIAGTERNHLVVEIVIRIVQQATATGAALAEESIGAWTLLQEIGEVLAA